eukprot:CAMPEP_0174853540 /NCGR_PEP_ID=MMETSP1114-20130205/28867_1 /TAXON_ID=312471 /ORGANISM="Neobodo designis, Strain CCAP 1951/1" /LENGTH=325 /DNA_ID=CAMNT_0016088195 /DNA_START=49 /DNA_END=1027 /DNA_ORIENTATION=-
MTEVAFETTPQGQTHIARASNCRLLHVSASAPRRFNAPPRDDLQRGDLVLEGDRAAVDVLDGVEVDVDVPQRREARRVHAVEPAEEVVVDVELLELRHRRQRLEGDEVVVREVQHAHVLEHFLEDDDVLQLVVVEVQHLDLLVDREESKQPVQLVLVAEALVRQVQHLDRALVAAALGVADGAHLAQDVHLRDQLLRRQADARRREVLARRLHPRDEGPPRGELGLRVAVVRREGRAELRREEVRLGVQRRVLVVHEGEVVAFAGRHRHGRWVDEANVDLLRDLGLARARGAVEDPADGLLEAAAEVRDPVHHPGRRRRARGSRQ